MNLCVKIMWEVHACPLISFLKKIIHVTYAKNILCVVAWKKLCLKVLFIRKLCWKNSFRIFIWQKLYVKIICIYIINIQNCAAKEKKIFQNRKHFFFEKPGLYLIHILMIPAQNLQRHSWKKMEIKSSPCKHLPVVLAAGSWSPQLEADFLSGEGM